jgi:endogenous inhibitor of DNA gyrase (YacG/DUF329 family)
MSNPYIIKTVKCADCGKAKQEGSHWFVLTVANGSFRCSPLGCSTAAEPTPLCGSPGVRLTKSQAPVCGQQCAQKVFERYLTGEMMRRPARPL